MHDNFTLAAAEFNFKPDGSFYDLFRLSFTSTPQAACLISCLRRNLTQPVNISKNAICVKHIHM